MVEWIAPISTLLGALVGVGATLLVDRARAKRDRLRQLDEARRQLYARYLEALTAADAELQMLAISEVTPVNVIEVRKVWRQQPLLALRYEIMLMAPQPVAEAADEAYARLRAMRNAIASTALTVGNPGHPDDEPGSPEWETVHIPYIEAIATLRDEMRRDVQRG